MVRPLSLFLPACLLPLTPFLSLSKQVVSSRPSLRRSRRTTARSALRFLRSTSCEPFRRARSRSWRSRWTDCRSWHERCGWIWRRCNARNGRRYVIRSDTGTIPGWYVVCAYVGKIGWQGGLGKACDELLRLSHRCSRFYCT